MFLIRKLAVAGVLLSICTFPQLACAESLMVIEEIIVTARKRTESMQDVPITINAVSGDLLESGAYQEMNDIDQLATNVVFEGLDRTKPLIFVRGIGTRTYDPGSDPSVGVFIDGVYLGRFGGLDMDLAEVERVEILKGPQGTLYGRNTIGGALSVVTKNPTEEFEAKLSTEIGSSEISGDDLWSVSARVAGELANSGILGSLAVNHRERDGYIRIANSSTRGANEDSTGVMGKLIFPLGESASLKLSADYSTMDGPALIFTRDDLNGRSPTPLTAAGIPIPIPPAPVDLYEPTANRTDVFTDKDIYGLSATIEAELGDWQFTSISSYREMEWIAGDDLDASELDVSYLLEIEDSDQMSQEFRFSRSGENTDLLVGLFYGRENVDRHDVLDFGLDGLELFVAALGVDLIWDFGAKLESTSYAAFAQFDWQFAEDWALTLGGRYSRDKKELDYNIVTLNILLPSFTLQPSDEWSSFDPSLSLKYNVSDDVMVYASYSAGYKSGAFQFFPSTASAARKIADPEEVNAIEFGVKTQLLDHRLQLNAAIFNMDYQDLQLLSLAPLRDENGTDIGTSAVLIDNAADSTIRGLEIEASALLSENWTVDINYGYLDAEFDEYIRGPGQDFSGNRLARSPEHSFNLALNYSGEFNFGGVDGRIGYAWHDEYFFEPDNNLIDPNSEQGSEGLLDGSVKFSLKNGWSVLLWGRNLTDERFRRSVLNSEGDPQRTAGIEPRTVGFRLTKEFGATRY